MLMLSMILDEEGDNLLLLYHHHKSTLRNNDFLFLLDSNCLQRWVQVYSQFFVATNLNY
jgi:hypothetical protein